MVSRVRLNHAGFSFTEVVIAVFLLAFVALTVLSMTQTGFLAQRRNQELGEATLVAQSIIAEMRVWGSDINNYQGSWGPYNRTFTYPGTKYEVSVRARAAGRPIASPSLEMESQWADTLRGARVLPKGVVPVELVISWSNRIKDRLKVVTYVAEPWRDVSGARFDVVGPAPPSIAMSQTSRYQVAGFDGAGRPLENLMYEWLPDSRFVSPASDGARDGRSYKMVRDKVITPPQTPPPSGGVPSPVQCYAMYAGSPVEVRVRGILLPYP